MMDWIFLILMFLIFVGGLVVFQKQYSDSMKKAREDFYKVTGRYPPSRRLK